ncbi:MAG: alpha/beta hydrolase [Holophagales bacterium]|nr:alpha/beta hydrolase [Holophagales bacterium]
MERQERLTPDPGGEGRNVGTRLEISLHGQRCSYRTSGHGPLLVLLHGIAGTSATWDCVIPWLAERYTVVAPDLIGHGESSKPEGDYSLGAYANGIRDLLEALGHERGTILGHSLGGGVALQFAYQFLERCERLVLVSSGGLGRELHPLLRAAALPGADVVLPWLSAAGEQSVGRLVRVLGGIGVRASADLEESWNSFVSLAKPAAQGVHPDRPGNHRRGWPADRGERPPLPRRRVADAHHLGRDGFAHPRPPRPGRPRADPGEPARHLPEGRPLSPPGRPPPFRGDRLRVSRDDEASAPRLEPPAQTAQGWRAGGSRPLDHGTALALSRFDRTCGLKEDRMKDVESKGLARFGLRASLVGALLAAGLAAAQPCPSATTVPNFRFVSSTQAFPRQVTYAWDVPAGAVSGTVYEILRAESGDYCAGFSAFEVIAETTATTHIVTLDGANRVYEFWVRVKGCNVAAAGAWIDDSFTLPPSAPVLAISATGANQVTLSLTPGDARTAAIVLERAGTNGSFQQIDTKFFYDLCPAGNTLTVLDFGLAPAPTTTARGRSTRGR